MIIDIHTHPPSKPEQWPGHLARMRDAGVSLSLASCLSANYGECSEAEVREANAAAAALTAAAGGAVRWLAFSSPRLGNCLEELELCLAQGALGVKLLYPLKDADGRLDSSFPVVEEAGRRKIPVLIHVFRVTDGNPPGHLDMRDFAALAARFPGTTLIAAHANGNWREGLAALSDCGPNACVDISGFYPERGLTDALVETVGAGRVLFGSDAPGRNPVSQMAKVFLSGLDDAARELVLWKNAARLFRIDPREIPAAPSAPAAAVCPVDLKTDHFCFCGRWPFFLTPCESPAELENELARHGVDHAYTADLGALLRTDALRANAGFLAAAGGCRRVLPLAVVNPRACDWERGVAQSREGFAGVLVSPYLHNWRLDDPAHGALFHACSNRGIPVWIQCALHDCRARHTSAAWRPVEAEELLAFAAGAPPNRYVCQGVAGYPMNAILSKPRAGAAFRFEISRLTDYGEQFGQMLRAGAADALVLGSEFPFRDMRTVAWTAARSARG